MLHKMAFIAAVLEKLNLLRHIMLISDWWLIKLAWEFHLIKVNIFFSFFKIFLYFKIKTNLNLECITAENYIKQYNNWCDEYSRYQKALNDWENLKDKSCSAATNMKTPRN